MQLYGDLRLYTNPSLVAQPNYAAQTSAYYWSDYRLDGLANTLADKLTVSAFQQITTKVQAPSTPHEATRELYYQKALQMIYYGVQPGETLNAVDGTNASTLPNLLSTLQTNRVGDMVTLTITSKTGHQFKRVVLVGDIIPGVLG
jgi:hypothetical protein